ncbi:MAG: proline--tRNA ligase [Rickettsiales bacterium]|nr:proline--tRNA ligase [Rickettsiales bacterium]
MKLTNYFLPTKKEVPSEAKIVSHRLMLRAGLIRMETSGIYSWLPLGYKVLEKIRKIIELEHLDNNINQMLMPTIQSSDIWIQSERFDSYGEEMLTITDRNKKKLLYGPTNEEMITVLGKDYIQSYKELPLYLYHIQSKFRDEIRPRFGVMRAREFLMKDAYSFDVDKKSAEKTYELFFNLYLNIFRKIGLDIIPVRALSGEIGGDLSHEFHCLCETGESEIVIDSLILNSKKNKIFSSSSKHYSSTIEYFEQSRKENSELKIKKSIELGHIFLFGDKYSSSFDFKINSPNGLILPYMGSYGIGLSRIPAASIEINHDEKGIIWPQPISPFDLVMINLRVKSEICFNFCEKMYELCKLNNLDILLDDRDERIGVKFSDADLIGIPFQLLVGKKFEEESIIELKNRKTGEVVEITEKEFINNYLKKIKQ